MLHEVSRGFFSLHSLGLLSLLLIPLVDTKSDAAFEAKMLYNKLFKVNGYNKLIRPVDNNTDVLTVKLGLRLSQLIDIDERNQIMTTNVWLTQEWVDHMLAWDPDNHANVTVLYVPADKIWQPDIVLYDNADGNYQVTLMTKATVHHTGLVHWEPPAIYKSSCTIDVEFFPFDQQTCHMKFASWTYDGTEVDLKHINQPDDAEGEVDIENAIDLTDYYRSFVWDVMSVPARRHKRYYPCCSELYNDVTFNVTIRRKTLFYTVNLIVPCVAISFLTVLVFFLPSDSGEKITLCISILLSLTVFFLLLSDLIPPTSLVVPLIGKYLLFTMILVTLSIIITVIVLNIHYRSLTTHVMSPWVRKVFLHIMPRLLMMKRPTSISDQLIRKVSSKNKVEGVTRILNGCEKQKLSSILNDRDTDEIWEKYRDSQTPKGEDNCQDSPWKLRCPEVKTQHDYAYSPALERALEGVTFIADHLKVEDREVQIKEDWKYVAMVLDRMFLWLFTTACVVGTFGIILQAPTLYDDTKPLELL